MRQKTNRLLFRPAVSVFFCFLTVLVRTRVTRVIILFLLVASAIVSAFPIDAVGARQTINFITTPPATGNYTISVCQGQLISKNTDIQVIVQPAQGSKAIPSLLESGDGQLANMISITSYWAYTGTEEYAKPSKFIRVLQSGNDNYFGLITRQETGIRTIPGLKGKRVTVCPTAPPVKQVMEVGLHAYGLTPSKDVTLLKAEDTPTALRDLAQGRTDVVSCSLTGSKIVEMATKTKIVVLPFSVDKISFLQNQLPGMFSAMTPSNLPGIDPGIPVFATPTLLLARADVSDEAVYTIVKTLMENYDSLKIINPVMAEWKPEIAVRELPIPYHPGAIKYYKEKGFWNGKMDQFQKKLISR